ncbi:MAG: radical SAM protein [Candidatus Omnitrophica bacterium]|nr:radical SAM protein [Candidatus Omnitrophota bacterium]
MSLIKSLKRKIYKAAREPAYALAVLIKRFASLFSYYVFQGRSSWPETVSLFLTYRCNLACSMCGYWGKCGSLKDKKEDCLREDLNLQDLEKIIDDIAGLAPNITLFGGEPFLYPDWPVLVKYIKNKGLRCNVVTNGTLLAAREQEVIDSGLDEIIFSLEGTQEIHDKITNTLGSFDKAFNALSKIAKLKKMNNLRLPKINVATTISEDNFSNLYEIFKTAEKLSPDTITFHHLSFVDRESVAKTNRILKDNFGILSRDWEGFIRNELPKIDTAVLIEEIKKIESYPKACGVFFYPDFRQKEIIEYYKDFNFKSKQFANRCLSPWMTVYIFPDGKVGPCEELNIYFGNIKKESFKDIWNNQQFCKFRKILKRERIFPVCTRCTELYRF